MRAQLPFELDYFSSKERSLIAQACPPEKEASEHGVRELCRRFYRRHHSCHQVWSRYRSTRPCPSNYIATLNNSDKEAKAISAKSNVVACYFSLPRIASPSRTVGPRVPVSERKRCALRALMLSATRRRRKTGFLRRKRRFDVVSHTRLAPYFIVRYGVEGQEIRGSYEWSWAQDA